MKQDETLLLQKAAETMLILKYGDMDTALLANWGVVHSKRDQWEVDAINKWQANRDPNEYG